jgi:hypothetical protein
MIAKFTLFDRSFNWVGGTCGGYEFPRWIRSDDKRYFHDHPWWFWTLVLRGGYTDVTPNGEDVLTRGSIRFRPSHHQHYVRIPKEGALTILLCGPQSRNWGFWVKGNHLRPLRFFSRHGHPPCSEQ